MRIVIRICTVPLIHSLQKNNTICTNALHSFRALSHAEATAGLISDPDTGPFQTSPAELSGGVMDLCGAVRSWVVRCLLPLWGSNRQLPFLISLATLGCGHVAGEQRGLGPSLDFDLKWITVIAVQYDCSMSHRYRESMSQSHMLLVFSNASIRKTTWVKNPQDKPTYA